VADNLRLALVHSAGDGDQHEPEGIQDYSQLETVRRRVARALAS
jgi:hypothetical protein